jgi:hypothetical protein
MATNFLDQVKTSIQTPKPTLAEKLFPKPTTQEAPAKPELGIDEQELRDEITTLSKTRSLEEVEKAIDLSPEIKDKQAAKLIATEIFHKTK